MLEPLRQMAIFAKTVDHGSFRAAARALNLSPSVVSHHITQLERQVGTALLYRSTRKLSLTSDGERLLAAAREMMRAAESGIQAVANRANQPSGELRVTAPAVMAQSMLVDRIAAFANDYPNIRLHLDFSDSRRNIIEAGIDVAIRMGWLQDSTLIGRKLYTVTRRVTAARSYLDARPKPTSPQDLGDWDWLDLSPVSLKPEFRKPGHRAVRLKPASRVSVNDAHALYRLARAGAGLAMLPEYLLEQDVTAGVMEYVLPDWSIVPVGVYAVWPPNAPKDGLTALFVEALTSRQEPN